MTQIVRRLVWNKSFDDAPERFVEREWLVSNGLGGYSAGTLAGVITRGFHGYLIAALPSPLGRITMLNDLVETVLCGDGTVAQLSGEERVNVPLRAGGSLYLREFRLEDGLPVWVYEIDGVQLEKKIVMVHRQNTVFIRYRTAGNKKLRLNLRPLVNFRPHEAPVSTPLSGDYSLTVAGDAFEVNSGSMPSLRLMLQGEETSLTMDRTRLQEVIYRIEQSRGYAARGDLWSPGYFSMSVSRERSATLIASTEPWEAVRSITPEYAESAEHSRRERLLFLAHPKARTGLAAELVLAADQFIIVPAGRTKDTLRAWARGDEVRAILAGYPWFTDWGRDTMITLEGLTLITGRHIEAGYILRAFSQYIRNGLVPNMFPEGQATGLYHTADATLWFFHAISRYLAISKDETLLPTILPQLEEIVERHFAGTDFGIGVDPADGLLRQGAPGYQLTWMDAKVDDWVVTPRRGKAVEINALWYNALRLLEQWLRQFQRVESAETIAGHAQRVRESFQKRFWYAEGNYLYDVVDGETGDDSSFRPNQLFSISLDYPVLEEGKWQAVLKGVEARLLTPFGLRTLAPGEKDYKQKYDGDLRSRDAAYHQGTVWPWLLGPFIDAWLKVYPQDSASLVEFLGAFEAHLNENAIGSVSEIFDAEPPYLPRGCVAQAWSVSEILRSLIKCQEPLLPRKA